MFDATFWRYLIVGVFCISLGSSIMFFAYNVLHLGYWLSSAMNYAISCTLNYFINRTYTFRNTPSNRTTAIRFAINIALCYIIAYGVAKPFVHAWAASHTVAAKDNIAMLAGVAIFSGLNYLGQRFFVFRKYSNKKLAYLVSMILK